MFENFPYTNFHDLNLDWIVQKIMEAYSPDNPPPVGLVLSVNGQTGEVILYQDPNVVFPPVQSTNWTITRTAAGHEVGLQLQGNMLFLRYDGTTSRVYTEASQPPYPVTSVNNKTGAVNIAIPITELSQDDAIWIASQDSPNNTAGIKRGTAIGPVSLWLDGTLDPISGEHISAYISWTDPADDTNVITQKLLTNADIPSGSGVISINGLTGVVTLTANNIPYNLTDTIKDKFDSLDTVQNNLALNMAPAYSSASTYAVGDIVTYQGRIYVCNTAISQPEAFNIAHWTVSQNMTYQINQIINRLITDESYIDSLQNSIGIVLNGNTTSVPVTAGQYVIVENSTITGITDGLYKAVSAWDAGDTVTAAYLAVVTNGGLNELSNIIANTYAKIDYYTLINGETVSATLQTKTLFNNRRFSDYKLVLAIVKRGGLFRTSMFIPVALIDNISLFEVDSTNTQRWYEVKYVSDISVTIQASSNATGAQLWLYGIITI